MTRILTILLSFLALNTYSQEVLWATNFGCINRDGISTSVVDSNGNSYHTGYFSEELTFEGSQETLNSHGNDDVFVAKFDVHGQLIWAKQIAGAGDEYAHELVLQQNGDLLLFGRFKGTVDFDMGDDIHLITSEGSGFNGFITNFDKDGNLIQILHFTGSGNNTPSGMSTDNEQSIYICGRFTGSIDCDPDINTTQSYSATGTDSYLIKLDKHGDFQWSKQLKGSASVLAQELYIYNEITYFVGHFHGNFKLIPENTQTVFSQGANDFFICRFSADGTLDTLLTFGSTLNDEIDDVLVNSKGIFLSGTFLTEVDIDPDPFTQVNLISNGGVDAFLLALDSDLKFLWAEHFGGSDFDRAGNLTFGPENELLFNLHYNGTVNILVASEERQFTSEGLTDFNILTIDLGSGAVNSNYEIKGPGGEGGTVAVLQSGELLIAGAFEGSTDFDDTDFNNYFMNSQGSTDGFIMLADLRLNSAIELHLDRPTISLAPVPAIAGEKLIYSSNSALSFVQIFDIQGRLFYQEHTSNPYIWLPHSLNAGLYLLHIKTDKEKQYIGKFIIK